MDMQSNVTFLASFPSILATLSKVPLSATGNFAHLRNSITTCVFNDAVIALKLADIDCYKNIFLK